MGWIILRAKPLGSGWAHEPYTFHFPLVQFFEPFIREGVEKGKNEQTGDRETRS
jgi:hypothetical protein